MSTDLSKILEEAIVYGSRSISGGKVATYIPELRKADPSMLEACLALPDGSVCTAANRGCRGNRFTIQSISNVLTLILALRLRGGEYVFSKVSMEPSGDPFNSWMKLETASERPFNPLINAGAIVTTSMIKDALSFAEIVKFAGVLLGDPELGLDEMVYHSENQHSARNRSLAYLLASKGLMTSDVDGSLDLYLRMCSLQSHAAGLAHMGLVLSSGGGGPPHRGAAAGGVDCQICPDTDDDLRHVRWIW